MRLAVQIVSGSGGGGVRVIQKKYARGTAVIYIQLMASPNVTQCFHEHVFCSFGVSIHTYTWKLNFL